LKVTTYIAAIDVSVGHHQWGVVLIEGLARDVADQLGVGTVGVRQMLPESVQTM